MQLLILMHDMLHILEHDIKTPASNFLLIDTCLPYPLKSVFSFQIKILKMHPIKSYTKILESQVSYNLLETVIDI